MKIKCPNGWKVAKCEEVIDVRDGTHDTPKYTSFGYPLITSKNLKADGIDFSSVSYISEKDHLDVSKRSKVDRGDILFAMIGTIGNPVIVDIDTEFSIKNVALFKFSNTPIDARYFKYLLGTPIITRQLNSEKRGGTQKFVSLKVLRNMLIPFPPLKEQHRIAAILDKADTVRRKREKAIRLTEELLRSLFLDMFGDPVTNPKGWEEIPFDRIVSGEIRNGLSPSTRGTYKGQVLTLSAITQKRFNINERKTGDFDICPPKNKVLRKSDLLVCRGNGNINLVGCAKFPDDDYDEILFPDTIIAAPIDLSIVERAYIETFWNSSSVRYQIEQQARTTNGTQKINQKILKNIKILLPPITLQREFSLRHYIIKAVSKKYSKSSYNNLFNSLLQKAFRGEL